MPFREKEMLVVGGWKGWDGLWYANGRAFIGQWYFYGDFELSYTQPFYLSYKYPLRNDPCVSAHFRVIHFISPSLTYHIFSLVFFIFHLFKGYSFFPLSPLIAIYPKSTGPDRIFLIPNSDTSSIGGSAGGSVRGWFRPAFEGSANFSLILISRALAFKI